MEFTTGMTTTRDEDLYVGRGIEMLDRVHMNRACPLDDRRGRNGTVISITRTIDHDGTIEIAYSMFLIAYDGGGCDWWPPHLFSSSSRTSRRGWAASPTRAVGRRRQPDGPLTPQSLTIRIEEGLWDALGRVVQYQRELGRDIGARSRTQALTTILDRHLRLYSEWTRARYNDEPGTPEHWEHRLIRPVHGPIVRGATPMRNQSLRLPRWMMESLAQMVNYGHASSREFAINAILRMDLNVVFTNDVFTAIREKAARAANNPTNETISPAGSPLVHERSLA